MTERVVVVKVRKPDIIETICFFLSMPFIVPAAIWSSISALFVIEKLVLA